MWEFSTRETITISRGEVHIVGVPEDLLRARDPRSLVGETVLLDGVERVVQGVETPAMPWAPGSSAFCAVGLLVKP